MVAESYLKTSYNNIEKVKQAIEIADKQQNELVVQSKKLVSKQPIKAIDLSSCKEIELEVTVRDALKSSSVLSRKRPVAYLIDKKETVLIEKLKVLGIQVSELKEVKTIEVETYKVTDYLRQAEKYEGVNMQEVSTELIVKQHLFETGTFIVYLNQHRGNLAVEVLEPEAPNSFVSFEVLPTELNAQLPIYRYLKQEKL